MPIKAVAFDAYGTLFDVYSVGKTAEELFPTKGVNLANIWRDKQIEYTRLRTMCDKYVDFWQVTRDALEYACEALSLPLSAQNLDRLMMQYAKLTAFDENETALKALKEMGIPMAILSNGTPKMLDSALSASGLGGYFDHVLSVEDVGKFKTAPEAYQMGPDAFGVDVSDILFVSSNCWDICGATWFGYTTLWLNRFDQPMERLGVEPHRVGRSLLDVSGFVGEIDIIEV